MFDENPGLGPPHSVQHRGVLCYQPAGGSISESQVETAKEIVTQTGADYLHLLPSPDLYRILSDITGVPTTFFVDSTGAQVGHAIVTAQSKEEWVETIDSMLAEVEA